VGIIKLKQLIPTAFLLLIFLTSISASNINVILTSPPIGSGFVELKSTVTYDGEDTVKCIYEYSSDGKDFALINETTDKNSGYSVYWQTSNVQNGQYVIKVTATDNTILHTHTRLMDVNNSSSSGPINPNTYWDSAFGVLKYKSQASFMHYGPRSELKVTYGNMPTMVKDRLTIDTQFTTDSGGMTRVILTSKEIPTELIEKEGYIGQVYTIELSMGGNIMSVSYDLSDIKSSGTEAFSNTFDQRLKVLETKVNNLETLLKNTNTDETDLSGFVTVAELNNAIKGLKTELGQTPAPDITVNKISDLNQSITNLARNYQTLSSGIKNLSDTTVRTDDLFYKYSMYIGVIAIILSIFSFVIQLKPVSNSKTSKQGIPQPRPIIPSTPRERKENKDNTIKDIDYIQRGYFK